MGPQKFKTLKKYVIRTGWIALLLGIPTIYGTYNIFKPEQFPIKFLRGEVVRVTNSVYLGPYPTEKEIKRLKKFGITEFVSLMNPSMPFESPLIEQEKKLTSKHRLRFQNVPLSYLPNLESRDNLEKVRDLADYVRESSGKLYIHCYLGRHRTTLFKNHFLQDQSQKETGP